MTSRCLVTGGRGFLGSHLVERLGADGYDVLAPDRSELDVESERSWHDFEHDVDAVVHAAAFVPAGAATIADVPRLTSAGPLATSLALRWAKEHGAHRFVYCSSWSVYAQDICVPVDENAAVGPSGAAAYYALSKLWGEQLCSAFGSLTGLSTVALRFSAIYGPRMHPTGVLPVFWNRARAMDALVVRAPEASADFIHVNDACEGVACALRARAPAAIYNIGSGTETTLQQLAHTAWRAWHPDRAPNVEVRNEPGRRLFLSIERARVDLDYRPRVALDAGLRDWARGS